MDGNDEDVRGDDDNGGLPNKKMKTSDQRTRRSSPTGEEMSPLLGGNSRPPPPPPASASSRRPTPPPSVSTTGGRKRSGSRSRSSTPQSSPHTTPATSNRASSPLSLATQQQQTYQGDVPPTPPQQQDQLSTAQNPASARGNTHEGSIAAAKPLEAAQPPLPALERPVTEKVTPNLDPPPPVESPQNFPPRDALAPTNNRPDRSSDNNSRKDTTDLIREWTLQVRGYPPKPRMVDAVHKTMVHGRGRVVPILITPEMTEERMGKCVLQASVSYLSSTTDLNGTATSSSSTTNDILYESGVTGLFRERDGLFVPLSSMLQTPFRFQKDIWTVDPSSCFQPPKREQKPEPFFTYKFILLLLLLLVVLGGAIYAVVEHQEIVEETLFEYQQIAAEAFQIALHAFISFPVWLVDTVIDLPLKEMYRYGPPIIGWEGARVANICARITYHGDELFWNRNLEECQRIFNAKEEAYLRTARPMVYLFMLWVAYKVLQSVLASRAERHRWKPDRDMVDTYRAFNMLMHQIGRHVNRNTIPVRKKTQ